MNTHYKVAGKALALADAFGFLYPAEVCLIQAIARGLPGKAVCVNIGAGVGTSALAMVEIRPDLQVFTIDISQGSPLGGLDNERNAFIQAEISPLPTQILGNSHEIHSKWFTFGGGVAIDLLMIDGEHTEGGLTQDMDGWLPYLAPDGYVLYHDYSSQYWAGITKVIDAKMTPKQWRYILRADTLIAFQRRGR